MPVVIPGASYDFGKVYAQTALQSQQLAAEQAANQERIALERARLAQQADAQRAEMEQRAKEFAASQGLTREGWQFQAGEAERGRQFASGERQAGQQFAAGEAEKGREFSSREAELARMFSRGERLDTQQFQAGENQKGREFATTERLAGQDFTAGQNQLSRDQAITLFNMQRDLSIELQKRGFDQATAERIASEQAQRRMADLNYLIQAKLEDKRQTGENARQKETLDFQRRNAVVNQALDFTKIAVSGNPMVNPAELYNAALPGMRQDLGLPGETTPSAPTLPSNPATKRQAQADRRKELDSQANIYAQSFMNDASGRPRWGSTGFSLMRSLSPLADYTPSGILEQLTSGRKPSQKVDDYLRAARQSALYQQGYTPEEVMQQEKAFAEQQGYDWFQQ